MRMVNFNRIVMRDCLFVAIVVSFMLTLWTIYERNNRQDTALIDIDSRLLFVEHVCDSLRQSNLQLQNEVYCLEIKYEQIYENKVD